MRSIILSICMICSMVASAQDTDTLSINHPEYLPALELGTEAPQIIASDTLGTQIKLSDYRGRYVVLDFWATWCGDCRREVPMLKKLYNNQTLRRIDNKEVQWLSFSFDDKEQSWRNFLRKEQFAWPQVSNLKRTREDPTYKAYQLNWIPAFFVIDPQGKIVGKAITAKGLEGVLQRLVAEKKQTAPHAGRPQDQVLRIPYSTGKSIYGVISEPTSDAQRHGIAIISHGFNGTHHFGRDYFQTLNDLGYAVYTFDFPCGSVNSQSDNNTMNMSITDEKEALKTIVKYFQKQQNIDKKRIVLIGESQGGLVSALAAAELKGQVSNLILIYPALCIPDNWNERYPRVEDIPEVSEIWGVKLGKKFMMDIRPMKPFETIGAYKGRVLIVHGTDDKVVPLDYSKRATETYRNATLKIINRAGHGFKPEERVLSNQYVREFLGNK